MVLKAINIALHNPSLPFSQVLHSRYVNGDLKAGGALTLNDELSQVSNVMNINANGKFRMFFS